MVERVLEEPLITVVRTITVEPDVGWVEISEEDLVLLVFDVVVDEAEVSDVDDEEVEVEVGVLLIEDRAELMEDEEVVVVAETMLDWVVVEDELVVVESVGVGETELVVVSDVVVSLKIELIADPTSPSMPPSLEVPPSVVVLCRPNR